MCNCTFTLNLTAEEVKLAAPLTENPSISGQRRREFAELFLVPSRCVPADDAFIKRQDVDARYLRSTIEVRRYSVQAHDGLLGHVDEFLVDSLDEEIHYLAVDTGECLNGRRVMVPPEWITSVNWKIRQIRLNCHKDAVKKTGALPG